MKRKGTTKIAAFLLSGVLLAGGSTGILPGAKQLDFLGTSMITASAQEHSTFWEDTCYQYTYKNLIFTFRVNKDSKRAIITTVMPKASSMPSDVWFPPTVSITQNGKTEKFNVTDVDSMAINAYSSYVKRLFLPYTITSLDGLAFYCCQNLESLNFVDDNNMLNNKACNIRYAAADSFHNNSPFIKNQLNKNGLALVGNCLLKVSATNPTELKLTDSKYSSVKYIARNAFSSFKQLKTIYLPQNLQETDHSVSPSTLTTVWYWDSSSNSYRNLLTDVQSGRKTASILSICSKCGGVFEDTVVDTQVSNFLVKKALQNCKLTYKGAVCNSYDAWTQYKIVYTLYEYIGKNYYHYWMQANKSANYVSEMYQTEVWGYKGEKTRGILCDDYAKMFEKLCTSAGVEAKRVETTSGQNHAFNVVRIGSQWFNLDCCAGWLGGTKTFLTPDKTIETIGSHTKKDADKTKYNCNRSIGDVNLDGFVDIADAQIILNAYSALASHMTPQFPEVTKCRDINYLKVLCDVDRNGKVEVEDAQLVCNYATAVTTRKSDRTGALYTSFEQYYWDQCGVEKNGIKYEGRWNQFLIPSMQNPPA